MTAPCKNCKQRHQGCHSTCERYKAFRAERDEILELKKAACESEGDFLATRFRGRTFGEINKSKRRYH